MLTLPENIERKPQAYAYVNFTVRMNQMQQPAQEGFPLLFGYLTELGIEPVGAAFYNYRRINMAETLDVEAGVAVGRTGPDSDRVKFGTRPGASGRETDKIRPGSTGFRTVAIGTNAEGPAFMVCRDLPGGRFVTLKWHGHPDKLEKVTGMLIGWLRLTQQPMDMEEKPGGDHFACRLEIYETDPDEEPDMDKWVTELAFKLKD